MAHVYIEKIGEHVGETVTIKGWVRTSRDSKCVFSFVNVNDGSSLSPFGMSAWASRCAGLWCQVSNDSRSVHRVRR